MSPTGRGYRDALTRNRAIKFFSLLLALTLWFFVMGEKGGFSLPPLFPWSLSSAGPDMVVTRQSPRGVKLRVSGSRSLLATMSLAASTRWWTLKEPRGKMVFSDLSEATQAAQRHQDYQHQAAEVELPHGGADSKRVPVSR